MARQWRNNNLRRCLTRSRGTCKEQRRYPCELCQQPIPPRLTVQGKTRRGRMRPWSSEFIGVKRSLSFTQFWSVLVSFSQFYSDETVGAESLLWWERFG